MDVAVLRVFLRISVFLKKNSQMTSLIKFCVDLHFSIQDSSYCSSHKLTIRMIRYFMQL